MWIVGRIPQLSRACFWFPGGHTCRRKPNICPDGWPGVRVVHEEEEAALSAHSILPHLGETALPTKPLPSA